MNIIAINKKTGTEYVFCRTTDFGDFYEVATEKSYPIKWVVKKNRVIFPLLTKKK